MLGMTSSYIHGSLANMANTVTSTVGSMCMGMLVSLKKKKREKKKEFVSTVEFQGMGRKVLIWHISFFS